MMTLIYCYCYVIDKHGAGEVGDACGMYGGGEECLQVPGGEIRRQDTT